MPRARFRFATPYSSSAKPMLRSQASEKFA